MSEKIKPFYLEEKQKKTAEVQTEIKSVKPNDRYADKKVDEENRKHEEIKQEILDILCEGLKNPAKLEAVYSLDDVLFLHYFNRSDLKIIINNERRTSNVGSSYLKQWLKKGGEKEDLIFEMERYRELLLKEFFNYSGGGFIKGKTGIVRSIEAGTHWGQKEAGMWFLECLIKNNPKEEKNNILKMIDLNDSKESIIKLAEAKVAKGLKLAEVAGDAWASLVAFMGGEGVYYYDGQAGIISPPNIESSASNKEKNELLDRYTYIHSKKEQFIKSIKPSFDYCSFSPKTYDSVFEDNSFDMFMAINHGPKSDYGDLEKIAQAVLKKGKKKNYKITQGGTS